MASVWQMPVATRRTPHLVVAELVQLQLLDGERLAVRTGDSSGDQHGDAFMTSVGGGARPGRADTTSSLGVEDEVVDDDLAVRIFKAAGVEEQVGLHRARDVIVVVRVAGEVELRRDQFVPGR